MKRKSLLLGTHSWGKFPIIFLLILFSRNVEENNFQAYFFIVFSVCVCVGLGSDSYYKLRMENRKKLVLVSKCSYPPTPKK